MSEKEHDLSRQQQKSAKSNVLAQVLEVKVMLDLPWEDDDKWELVGENFSKTLTTKDAEELTKGEKMLRFKVKPNKKGYTLVHHRSKGSKYTIFRDIPLQYSGPIDKEGKSTAGRSPMTEAGIGPVTDLPPYLRISSQVPTKLPDRHGTARDVDKDLIQDSPVLVDLKVEDPEL